MKMRVLLARHEERLCAGLIYSALGDTALYLFGATNDAGMKTSASYLLQWEAIKRLKADGLSAYDLHGINPELNPGTYHFKKGLAGKKAIEFTFAGQFSAFDDTLGNRAVLAVERARQRLRAWRARAGTR
jgi:lipid II:glycine glycyltransferase (peptidoglycan interpeptide bridge formation enzyme)